MPTSVHAITAKANSFGANLATVGVLPTIKPVPWSTFFVLLVFVSIPPIGFIYGFSAIGEGVTQLSAQDDTSQDIASTCSSAVGLIMAVLYLLDFSSWTSALGRFVRVSSLVIVAVLIATYLLLTAKISPSGLIILYTLGTVAWFIATKHMIYFKTDFRDYVSWLTGPLLFSSLATFAVFIWWVNSDRDNTWNQENIVRYAKMYGWDDKLTAEEYVTLNLEGCYSKYSEINATYAQNAPGERDFSLDDLKLEKPLTPCMTLSNVSGTSTYFSEDCPMYCSKIYTSCTVSFIIWATPMIMGVVLFFLSFVCGFLNPESSANAPTTFSKIFIMLLFGLWCTASLAGAGAGLVGSFSAFFVAASVAIGMIVIATFGVPSSTADLQELEFFKAFKKKYGWAIDGLRSMIVVTASPVVLMYCCASVVNQCIRRIGLPCSKRLDPEKGDGKLWLTRVTTDQIADFKRWDHSKIYKNAVIIGLVYITMQVLAAKWTILFLAWMKQECAQMNFIAVTLIIVGVGLTLFLLPPIPGVPIYLTGGLMIPPVATGYGVGPGGADADPQFPGGVPGAVCYTIAVGVLLKLLACTLQQKMFGENLSQFVGVRQMVSINSGMIRTMKLILMTPGISITKVAILVGGPDWPTSVLCGIMRLPLFQVLLGTLPVFFLIVPTVLAGSFLWMGTLFDPVTRQPRFEMAGTLSPLFMVVAATVQSGSMVVAAFYLEKAITEQSDKIAELPIDQEVLDADNRGAMRRLIYVYVTQWHKVPYFWKKLLHLSVFCIVMSCYLIMLTTSGVTFTLTNKPSDLPDGKWYNLLNFNGWLAMFLYVFSWILLYAFQTWAASRVDAFEKSGEVLPPEFLTQTSELEGDVASAAEGGGSGGEAAAPATASMPANKVVPLNEKED